MTASNIGDAKKMTPAASSCWLCQEEEETDDRVVGLLGREGMTKVKLFK